MAINVISLATTNSHLISVTGNQHQLVELPQLDEPLSESTFEIDINKFQTDELFEVLKGANV